MASTRPIIDRLSFLGVFPVLFIHHRSPKNSILLTYIYYCNRMDIACIKFTTVRQGVVSLQHTYPIIKLY